MCKRIFMQAQTTVDGKNVSALSIDARITMTRSTVNDETSPLYGRSIVMFSNSNRQGVVVFCEDIKSIEFTDAQHEWAFNLEYVAPAEEAETANAA